MKKEELVSTGKRLDELNKKKGLFSMFKESELDLKIGYILYFIMLLCMGYMGSASAMDGYINMGIGKIPLIVLRVLFSLLALVIILKVMKIHIIIYRGRERKRLTEKFENDLIPKYFDTLEEKQEKVNKLIVENSKQYVELEDGKLYEVDKQMLDYTKDITTPVVVYKELDFDISDEYKAGKYNVILKG